MRKALAITWGFFGSIALVSTLPLTPFFAFSSTLSPATQIASPQKSSFLTNVIKHLEHAVERAGFRRRILDKVLVPERVITIRIPVEMDDGTTREFVGWRVIHNTSLGAGKGGIRVRAGLKLDEVKALATEMSIKNAVAQLELGGAKGGIDADPAKLSRREYARLMRGYVEEVMNQTWSRHNTVAFSLLTDVPAPDVGTSPKEGLNLMNLCVDQVLSWCARHSRQYAGWVKRQEQIPEEKRAILAFPSQLVALSEETAMLSSPDQTPYLDLYLELRKKWKTANRTLALLGAFTGKEAGTGKGETDFGKGGSKGRSEATGLGLAFATIEILKATSPDAILNGTFSGQRVAVQGFGNVGNGAVKAFTKLGAKVVAIAEYDSKTKSSYAIFKQAGFSAEDIPALEAYWAKEKTLIGFPNAKKLEINSFWRLNVDILAPCAAENQIDGKVAQLIRAPLVVEGANGPTTPEGDAVLNKKHITVIPDVLANGGGVTVSYFEMVQNQEGVSWEGERVHKKLAENMAQNCDWLAAVSKEFKISLREAAYLIALGVLEKKMIRNGEISERVESLRLPQSRARGRVSLGDTVLTETAI